MGGEGRPGCHGADTTLDLSLSTATTTRGRQSARIYGCFGGKKPPVKVRLLKTFMLKLMINTIIIIIRAVSLTN